MSLLQNSNAIPQLGGYNLTDSVRFRSSGSAYLSRTPSSTSNRRTFTMSMWVKVGDTSNDNFLFSARVDASNTTNLQIQSNSQIGLYGTTSGAVNIQLASTPVFRDPSAWYHVVVAYDTTQGTATNRIKIYVNNEQITSFTSSTYPAQNYDTHVNRNTAEHRLGSVSGYYFDGYMTEVNFIDGQQLTPSDFGEYDDTTGVWKPKKYTGSYGTNGFYLPMNATRNLISTDYLVIAGGGSGGSRAGGGGGAGGYLTSTAYLKPSTTYTITVGAGGAAVYSMPSTRGNTGTNSVLSGTGITTVTSIGGGGGGVYPGSTGLTATTGGSGGGGGSILGSTSGAGAAGTSGQGNAGGDGATSAYNGGGGGGAGSAGSQGTVSAGGTGGSGLASSITGSSVTRAGGGGGSPAGSASGGGGAGGAYPNGNGTAGTVNTGGGGGGARNASDTSNVYSGAGGSGVVILRLLTSEYTGTTTGSPTVTTDGSYTVLTYISSGTYTA